MNLHMICHKMIVSKKLWHFRETYFHCVIHQPLCCHQNQCSWYSTTSSVHIIVVVLECLYKHRVWTRQNKVEQ